MWAHISRELLMSRALTTSCTCISIQTDDRSWIDRIGMTGGAGCPEPLRAAAACAVVGGSYGGEGLEGFSGVSALPEHTMPHPMPHSTPTALPCSHVAASGVEAGSGGSGRLPRLRAMAQSEDRLKDLVRYHGDSTLIHTRCEQVTLSPRRSLSPRYTPAASRLDTHPQPLASIHTRCLLPLAPGLRSLSRLLHGSCTSLDARL